MTVEVEEVGVVDECAKKMKGADLPNFLRRGYPAFKNIPWHVRDFNNQVWRAGIMPTTDPIFQKLFLSDDSVPTI